MTHHAYNMVRRVRCREPRTPRYNKSRLYTEKDEFDTSCFNVHTYRACHLGDAFKLFIVIIVVVNSAEHSYNRGCLIPVTYVAMPSRFTYVTITMTAATRSVDIPKLM